jgi:hypothetical protein
VVAEGDEAEVEAPQQVRVPGNQVVVVAAVEAVVTPEMRVGLEAQEERAEQEPPKHLTAYL